jgi:hypothetical protein
MGFQADLTGTVGGEPATGYLTAQWNCVSSFFLRVDANG